MLTMIKGKKVKLSLYLTKHHNLKTNWGSELKKKYVDFIQIWS